MNENELLNFNQRVISEINVARTFPRIFATKAFNMVSNYKGTLLKIEGNEVNTKEGVKGLLNAIAFLRTVHPLYSYNQQDEINRAAEEQLNNFQNNKEEEELRYRLNTYCYAFGNLIELMSIGDLSPFNIVLNFIIGDGDKSKEARQIIFSQTYKDIGISSGILPGSKKNCVILNFVQHFFHLNDTIPSNLIDEYEDEIKEIRMKKEEKTTQKKNLPFKELSNFPSPTRELNSVDFMLSMTRPKPKYFLKDNEFMKNKDECEEFFMKGEDDLIYNNIIDEEILEDLPEGIKKIIVRNIKGKKGKTLVRKKIFYNDETIDTIFFYK